MKKQASEKYLATGMVVSMCLWGLNWPSGKVLTHYCSVINITVYRFILVGIALLILLPLFGISLTVKRQGIPLLIISGVLLALYSVFLFQGLKAGAAGAGGVLVTTLNPIMVYALGMIINKRMPSVNESIGLLLGLAAGVILLRVWENTTTLLQKGNLYFLLTSLTWAVLSMFTARGAKYGSSMGFSLWQYLITLFCLLPFANFTEMYNITSIKEPVFWSNLFFSAVIVTALATTVYFYTTTRLGAAKASSFIFLVPMAAAVSSWLFLGERILPNTAIGGVLGMAAVYIMNRRKKAPAKNSN